jgi:hypothetical protein
MIPLANIHKRSSGVLCPLRLSKTTNILNGGSSSGSVTFTVSPSCQLFHTTRFSPGLSSCGGGGKVLRMALKCSLSQGWSPALVQFLTPLTRTFPVAGWKEAHELGCAIPQVLVRVTCWFALHLPARSGIGHCLKRSGLIYSPHRDACLFTLSVSALDQIF